MRLLHPSSSHTDEVDPPPTRRSSDLSRATTRSPARSATRASASSASAGSAPQSPSGSAHSAAPSPTTTGTECAEPRSEEHTSELQSHVNIVCRLLPVKKYRKNLT